MPDMDNIIFKGLVFRAVGEAMVTGMRLYVSSKNSDENGFATSLSDLYDEGFDDQKLPPEVIAKIKQFQRQQLPLFIKAMGDLWDQLDAPAPVVAAAAKAA